MKKFILITLLFCNSVCFAEEPVVDNVNENIGELRLNFKRVSFDFASTKVENSEEYQDSSVTALNANNETMIKGTFDFALEYEKFKYRWDNKLFLTYGKTTVKDNVDGSKTVSENADEILATSEYTIKLWRFNSADLGPFGSLSYQTEFKRNGEAPLSKIARGKLGIKLLNNLFFTDLYATNIFEYDFTYDKEVSKYGLEVGLTTKYNVREGADFKLEGYARNYVSYSRYNPNDLEYDLNFTLRMDVNIVKKLNISPFISFRQAKSRAARHYARNNMIGISFLYTDLFSI